MITVASEDKSQKGPNTTSNIDNVHSARGKRRGEPRVDNEEPEENQIGDVE